MGARVDNFLHGPAADASARSTGVQLRVYQEGIGVQGFVDLRASASLFRAGARWEDQVRFGYGGELFQLRFGAFASSKLGTDGHLVLGVHLNPKQGLTFTTGVDGFAGLNGTLGLKASLAHLVHGRERELAKVTSTVSGDVGARGAVHVRVGEHQQEIKLPLSGAVKAWVGWGAGGGFEAENETARVKADGHAGAGVGVKLKGAVNAINVLNAAGRVAVHNLSLGLLDSKTATNAAPRLTSKTEQLERREQVLNFISRLGLVSTDQVAERFKRPDETADKAAGRFERMLARLAADGHVELKTVRVPDGPANEPTYTSVRAVSLTAQGAREFKLLRPPKIREAFLPHHLKTVDGMLAAARSYEAKGHQVLEFWSEDNLIRKHFRGHLFNPTLKPADRRQLGGQEKNELLAKFPDGLLIVRPASGGAPREVNVEFVSSKYTDKMISDKAKAFGAGTVWVTDRQSAADRINSLTGAKAVLV